MVLIFLPSLIVAQSYPYNDGKCYGLSKVPDKYFFKIIEYPIYIGPNAHKYKYKKKKLTLKQTRYASPINKIGNEQSLERDLEIKEILVAGEYKEIEVLKNPKKVPDDEWEYVEYKVEIFEKGMTLYKESLCEEDLNEEFILNLRKSFFDRGYEVALHKDSIDEALCVVLVRYQLDTGLAAGCLDIDTLKTLGLW